jgi:hypothetical protein
MKKEIRTSKARAHTTLKEIKELMARLEAKIESEWYNRHKGGFSQGRREYKEQPP